MRNVDSTQFSISIKVKNTLDRYKAENKEKILVAMKKKKRMVTNSDAIEYLLMEVKRK